MNKTELIIETGKFICRNPISIPMHLEVKYNIPLYIRRIKKHLEDAIYE